MLVDNIEIIDSVDNKVEQVRTRSLDLSFNELLDMYENEELIINPEYQRLFRWGVENQSRFIESLILEMPIPPIFVIETDTGEYELIDGLQRISTYLHFRGSLKDESGNLLEPLKLEGCDIVTELNNMKFEELPKSMQIRLKRNFIRVEILRKESDNRLRYYMFKRLNTGGEILSKQEIRNCTIRLLDSRIHDIFASLSKNEFFMNLISKIKSDEIDKKLDQELVLRFFTLKNNIDEYYTPFDDYLTKYMEDISKQIKPFDIEREKDIFIRTFTLLDKIDKNTFSSILSTGENKENFVMYYFEAFSLGVQKDIDRLEQMDDFSIIKQKFDEIKNLELLKPHRTGSQSNVKKRIEIIENKLEELLNDSREN